MRRLKAILLIFIASIFFTSCNLPIVIGQPSRESQLKAIAETAPLNSTQNHLYDYSPNGRWILTDDFNMGTDHFVIREVAEPHREISLDLSAYQLNSYSLGASWSPNSKFLILQGYPKPGRCNDTSWFLVQVLDDRLVEKQFIYPSDSYSCAGYVWSPDSKAVAVYDSYPGEIEINYLNTGARSFYSGFLKDEEILDYLYWVEDGILLMTRQNVGIGTFYELRNGEHEFKKLFEFHMTKYFDHLLSTDNHITKVLISTYISNKQDELAVINLQDQSRKTVANGPGFGKITSGRDKGSSVALETESEDGKKSLWIYSWENGELSNKGEINTLLNWNEPMHGFVVLTGEDDQVEAKLISP